MKAIAILAALALTSCAGLTIRATHTLADGTKISTDGRTLSVSHGKDVIEFELPRK